MRTIQQELLQEIEAFCAETGMAESYFGRLSVGAWTVVQRLREGRSIELKTVDRIRSFIASHKSGGRKPASERPRRHRAA
jgi:hypothetical protein